MPERIANVWVVVREERQGRYLLLRRSRIKPNGGQWNFPGGGVEKGEKPKQAAKRELLEETGVKLKGLTRCAEADLRRKTYYYRVEVPRPFIPTLNEEHDAFIWAIPESFTETLHKPTLYYLHHFAMEI